MGTKRTYIPFMAMLLFILPLGSILFALLSQPATARQPLSSASLTITDTPTCTPPTWGVASSPNVEMGDNFLYSVAAASASDVWAVGASHADNSMGTPAQTLVERWNGSTWDIVPSLNVGAESNSLLGVAVVSVNDVWAVGSYDTGRVPRTLIERWNGSAWSVIPSPNVGTGGSSLTGVAVVSASDVWAVGNSGSPSQTLVEHWNGATWDIVSSPNVGSTPNFLNGVSAAPGGSVWAVGYYFNGTVSQTLAEHWNGSTWDIIPSPNVPNTGSNFLNGVAAVSANDAWAVGHYFINSNITHTLIEHWDGSAWSVADSPNVGTGLNKLNGIAAPSANDAWAVGYYCNGSCGSLPHQTLILHRTCGTWSVVPSQNVGAGYNELIGVAATPANAWAVGYYRNSNSTYQTLAEQWQGVPCDCPLPTSVPTVVPSITPCQMNFSDVQPTDYFYTAVRYLYCAGVISGYSDGTFQPGNNTTRGQLCKIVVLAQGWPVDCPLDAHFSDVPTDNVFFCFVETALSRGLVSGYSDGTFGVGNDVTRAQLCKIIVQAQQWPIDTTGGPHFTDVPQTDTFYGFIETAYNHRIVSGYTDGTFDPGNSATRAQICKIVYLAIRE